MSIIRYKCDSCGHEFPKLVVTPDKAPRQCPVCAAENPTELGPAFYVHEESVARRGYIGCHSCDETLCEVLESR